MSVGTLYHKLNNWVTFDFEQSLHDLRDGMLQAFPSRRKATPPQFQAIDSRAHAVASSGRESSSHP